METFENIPNSQMFTFHTSKDVLRDELSILIGRFLVYFFLSRVLMILKHAVFIDLSAPFALAHQSFLWYFQLFYFRCNIRQSFVIKRKHFEAILRQSKTNISREIPLPIL
jgi:hypothetical protein